MSYFRTPAIYNDQIIFISEDDLWSCNINGKNVQRLTSGLGEASNPVLSLDGTKAIFTSTEEGHSELYALNLSGGNIKRLTFLGGMSKACCFKDNDTLLFLNNAKHAFGHYELCELSLKDLSVKHLGMGHMNACQLSPKKDGKEQPMVVQRHGYGYASWKRYKGGTAGQIWIDRKGDSQFDLLIDKKGNFLSPMWIKDRIYFISDFEGFGNLYSVDIKGHDLKKHTHHDDYYVRSPSSDGNNIVYHAGGEVFIFNPNDNKSEQIQVNYVSAYTQRQRRFSYAFRYLEGMDIHPSQEKLLLNSRGKSFVLPNFYQGAAEKLPHDHDGRSKCAVWLKSDTGFVVEHGGHEWFRIVDTKGKVVDYKNPNLGKVIEVIASPNGEFALFQNHRHEVILLEVKKKKWTVLDKGHRELTQGINWSSCSQYVTYALSVEKKHQIKIYDTKSEKGHCITDGTMDDCYPVFDPNGKYLFFVSYRQFDPIRDQLRFGYSFSLGSRIFGITLQKDTYPLFEIMGHVDGEAETKKDLPQKKGDKNKKKEAADTLNIDWEGIQDRIFPLRIKDGIYHQLAVSKEKLFFINRPIVGGLSLPRHKDDPDYACLESFDLNTGKQETVAYRVRDYKLSYDCKYLLLWRDSEVRVIKSSEKQFDAEKDTSYKRGGKIDFSRVALSIDPPKEWQQIYTEAWVLQRELYWNEDMNKVDWKKVYKKYEALLNKISCRNELTDVIYEMQGELGTSHAYVQSGDYRPGPHYGLGYLAADVSYHKDNKGYKIDRIVKGDGWEEQATSPLLMPGLNIKEGDVITHVMGQAADKNKPLESFLVNQSNQRISLMVKGKSDKSARKVFVKTIPYQIKAYYREWINRNTAYVHEKTKGKIGYIHVPDMSVTGYSEFYRAYAHQFDCEGLIIDVRFNRGGNISTLLLDTLTRKRVGYDLTRWSGKIPYAIESPNGPMVALCNENTASDGDMFSYFFKRLKLGKLIGKRTWGGVVGIMPRFPLVDGGITTQPEFAVWFDDVGFSVENHGVDPDIVVENKPQDYLAGKDKQLDAAIAEILKDIKSEDSKAKKTTKK